MTEKKEENCQVLFRKKMSKFLCEIKHDPFSLTFCYIFSRFSVLVTHVLLNASSRDIQIRWWFLLFSNFQVSDNISPMIKQLWAFRTNKWSIYVLLVFFPFNRHTPFDDVIAAQTIWMNENNLNMYNSIFIIHFDI